MNSFFNKWYDPIKDRRYGMLFLITVVVLFCVFALGMFTYAIIDKWQIEKSDLQSVFLRSLPGIVILTAALIWRGVRRYQPRRKENFKRSELSREEIRKARSKLVKNKN